MACEDYKKQLDKLNFDLDDDGQAGKSANLKTTIDFRKALLKTVGTVASDLATQYTNEQFQNLRNSVKDLAKPLTANLVMVLSLLPEIEIISAAILCFKIKDSIEKRLVIAQKIESKLIELMAITDELSRGLPNTQGEDALIIQVRQALNEIKIALRELSQYYLGMNPRTIDDPDNPGKQLELSGTGATKHYNEARLHNNNAIAWLSKESSLTASTKKLVKDIERLQKSYKDKNRSAKSLTRKDAQIIQDYIENVRQLQIRENLFNGAVYISNQIPLAIAVAANLAQDILLSKNKTTWKNAGDSLKENLLKEDLKSYQEEVVVYLKNLRENQPNWELLKSLSESLTEDSTVVDIVTDLKDIREAIESDLDAYNKDNQNNMGGAYNDILYHRTLWNAKLNVIETEFTMKDVSGSAALLQSTEDSLARANAVNNVYSFINSDTFRDSPYDLFILHYVIAYTDCLMAVISQAKAVKSHNELTECLSDIRIAIKQDNQLIALIKNINIENMASYKAYQALMNKLSSIPGGNQLVSTLQDSSRLLSQVTGMTSSLKRGLSNGMDLLKTDNITDKAKCLAEMLFLEKPVPEDNAVSSGLTVSVVEVENKTTGIADKILESRKTAVAFQQSQLV